MDGKQTDAFRSINTVISLGYTMILTASLHVMFSYISYGPDFDRCMLPDLPRES
jgi:hypothetical protein